MSIINKRWQAGLLIGAAVTGTGVLSATPTPAIEIPKQAGIVAADMLLCLGIARTYFGDEYSSEKLGEVFSGLAASGGIGALAGYGTYKLLEAVAAEGLNFVPVAGWALSGVLTAGATATVGTVFWIACDRAYRSGRNILTELLIVLTIPEIPAEPSSDTT